MPLLSQNDFNSVLEAVQLRGALIAVDKRSARQETGTISAFGVYIGDNKAFASDLIGSEKIVTLPKYVHPGVLIEYSDTDKGKSAYGLVIEPPILASTEQIYVKPLSKPQVDELLAQLPDVPKVVINQQGVKSQHPLDSVPKVVSFNNPIERLFFGVLKDTLHKLTEGREGTDILMWIYIGAVLLGGIGMAIVFLRGNS